MGKGEIALYEQVLLFPKCFEKACFPAASKGVIVWDWVKEFQDTDCIENIEGKGEIAHFEQFHLFRQYFPNASFFNEYTWREGLISTLDR